VVVCNMPMLGWTNLTLLSCFASAARRAATRKAPKTRFNGRRHQPFSA
jgi:hypothetical protein